MAFSERNIFHDQRSTRFNVDQLRRAASSQDGTYWTANRYLSLNSSDGGHSNVREQVDVQLCAGGGSLGDRLLDLAVRSHLGIDRRPRRARSGQARWSHRYRRHDGWFCTHSGLECVSW